MSKKNLYIVGAGPGNPDLLTVKAYRLITEKADVVVYDRLVSKEILCLIPDKVELIYAGKSSKKHIMTQDEINKELLRQSYGDKCVVRLKGGDPFIFGRGGEEADFLKKNGINFEIVPGINAASGISSSLGIPLTYRGIASGVQYITGHKQAGCELDLDWKSLANADTTLVIYMGLEHLEEISENLIKYGRLATTPAIAIECGTTPRERICTSTISDIAKRCRGKNLKPPVIVIIGDVVELASNTNSISKPN